MSDRMTDEQKGEWLRRNVEAMQSGRNPMSDWKENAKAWRELYRKVTLDHEIPHDGETVQAESQFRRLVDTVEPHE